MTSLLVTGAAGFIGSHFVRYWTAAHPDDAVVALDALTYAGVPANLDAVRDRITFVHGDIGDTPLVSGLLDEHDVEVVVNFAAESHNSLAVLDPARFFRTNVLGTQSLLEAARQVGIGRFHHVSTCEVYGDLALDAEEAFTESSPYRPRTPYNASKAGGDHAVRAYHETFGLPVSITNCANNYGSHQFPEKVLPLFVTRALDGAELPVYRSKDNRREWVHAVDHCRAIDVVLERGRVGETYHVGTGDEASVEQLADLVLDELGKGPELKTTVADRPGHDRRYLLDSSRIREELGWEPTIPFEEGVRDTIRWYADNRSWWEPLRARSPVTEGGWARS
ncbi:dTDP-glucose 4,6-dehydratase [Actinosynnema sp. NPDC023587]|uniref:dTDP-glucose 4,6-dehydratase n=1 Tax=Actinosynnema sp. NPDC023587 TaxID=3154695 RepID=UPI0034072AE5